MKFSIMQYAKDCNMPLITTISFYRIYGFFDSLVWENYNILSRLIHSVSYNSHAGKEIELDFIFVSVLSFQKGVDLLPNLHPCILPSSKQHIAKYWAQISWQGCALHTRNFRPEFWFVLYRIIIMNSYFHKIIYILLLLIQFN